MIDIQLQSAAGKAVVTIGGKLFTEYVYGHYICRPCLYPVLTPDGQRLTRAYPFEDVAGENQDHFHHRSIYTAHGLVNGFNLWDENVAGPGHGSMLQRGEPRVSVDDGVAHIDGTVDWYGPGGQQLLEERRRISIQADGDLRVIDQSSELRALYGEVVFGDTKEGGMFAIRVPTTMDAKDAGRIENSEGDVYDSGEGEETTWGKRAAWVDYSGPVADGQQWGHTVIDHVSNPWHPTYWHVRGYGLFTANPFGVHDFLKDETQDGSWTISKGDTASSRFRLIIHPGRGIAGNSRIAELIEEYQSFGG
ncbi:MAG: PmoA family protein [bacterium]|nr:PmoA family protein [bacterium]